MKLHYFPVSTYSQKVALALYERGIDFQPQVVAPSAFSTLPSPLKRLPVLQLDAGEVVFESSIIIERLDALPGPGPRLFPEGAAALEARFWDRIADLYVNDPVLTVFFDGRKPAAERNPAAVKRAKATLDAAYRMLDERLDGRSFFADDRFTVADCSALPALALAGKVHPFHGHTNLRAYFVRMAERPSFLRVQSDAVPWLSYLEAT
jgi:glutathione S-transferase